GRQCSCHTVSNATILHLTPYAATAAVTATPRCRPLPPVSDLRMAACGGETVLQGLRGLPGTPGRGGSDKGDQPPGRLPQPFTLQPAHWPLDFQSERYSRYPVPPAISTSHTRSVSPMASPLSVYSLSSNVRFAVTRTPAAARPDK